jgi:hypothetical protein
MKKVNSIKRVLELLKHKLDDDYIERAESELGPLSNNSFEFEPVEDNDGLYRMVDNDTPTEKKHARKVFKYAQKLEDTEWKEIWHIIGGNQSISEYKKLLKSKSSEELITHDVWVDWFNGSDMRGWWD